jgi:hypothetical protein
MKEKELDHLIQRFRGVPLPDCPGALESNVLRRIRLAAEDVQTSMFDWFLGLLARPGYIATALALAVTVSTAITVVSTRSYADAAPRGRTASNALGFDVFQNTEFFNIHHP